jgi:cellulose biosynthesis protein BcsQ
MYIISFNSYKGGACRTTTCYNALPYLAKKLGATTHQPILVFDVDLDSMGLTNLFTGGSRFLSVAGYSASNLFVKGTVQPGKEDIDRKIKLRGFIGAVEDNEWFFEKAFYKVGQKLGLEDDGSVLFCGADSEADSISDTEYAEYADSSPILFLLAKLRSMSENNRPKAIVFDCAAGVQLSTRVILSVAQKFVMCMRPTLQFRIGTRDYLLNKIPAELRKAKNNDKREIYLVPTAVATIEVPSDDPNREAAIKELTKMKYDVQEKIEDYIIGDVTNCRDLGYELNTKMIDDEEMGIPEIERFKWKEGLLYTMEALTNKERNLKARYEYLADIITQD